MVTPFTVERKQITATFARWDVSRSSILQGSLYKRPDGGPLVFCGGGVLGFTASDLRALADRMEAIERGETP